jgi:tryptophanyl-tRNA synthetase
VDLHAITMPQDPEKLRRERREMAITLLACGVDPKKCILFEQSKVCSSDQDILRCTLYPTDLLL